MLGLTCKERLHVCISEHPHQNSQMIVINIENINCDIFFGSLNHHEIKLRKLNFEFEGNLEALNEPEIKIILQLRDHVDHFLRKICQHAFMHLT